MDKIIRSVLYVPGVNERAIQKARQLPCDAIIFDLEDAVAPDRKADARRVICESLCRYDYGDRLLIVRINRLDTAWGEDDLKSLVDTNIDAICLRKVESSGEVVHANLQVIKHFEKVLNHLHKSYGNNSKQLTKINIKLKELILIILNQFYQ